MKKEVEESHHDSEDDDHPSQLPSARHTPATIVAGLSSSARHTSATIAAGPSSSARHTPATIVAGRRPMLVSRIFIRTFLGHRPRL